MVLESTVLCVDNTEYMRNGDYPPTRFHAQQDAAGVVISSKILANAENNVGMLSLSDGRMVVNLTQDQGKLLAHLHQLAIEGEMKFITGIKVAQLALKHRQGKNHRTRIVAFVGSPISDDEKELVKLAKRLKKEKVSVDVVLFGQEDSQNSEYLQAFINTLNGKEGQNSRLLTVPPGPSLPDTIMSSAIVRGEDGAGPAPMAAGGQGVLGDLGFDPTEDPELALALRVSMEEQHARQQVNTAPAAAPMSVDNPAAANQQTSADASAGSSVHDPVLQQALAMSVNAQSNSGTSGSTAQQRAPQQQSSAPSGALTRAFDDMNEDEQLAYALQMSMQDAALPQEDAGSEQQQAPSGGNTAAGRKKPDDHMDVDDDKPSS